MVETQLWDIGLIALMFGGALNGRVKSGHLWTAENRPFPIAARDVDAGRGLDVPAPA